MFDFYRRCQKCGQMLLTIKDIPEGKTDFKVLIGKCCE